MPFIYHVATEDEWNAPKERGMYVAASLENEGFVHCSQDHQVASVLERYFAGKSGLIKLEIDTSKLTSRFVFEWSPSARDTFPHIYGPINLDAITGIVSIHRSKDYSRNNCRPNFPFEKQ